MFEKERELIWHDRQEWKWHEPLEPAFPMAGTIRPPVIIDRSAIGTVRFG
jgi:hypothetical protein